MSVLFVLPFIPSKNAPQAGHRLAFDFIANEAAKTRVDVFLILRKRVEVPNDLKELLGGRISIYEISPRSILTNILCFRFFIYPRFLTRYSKFIFNELKNLCKINQYDKIIFEFSQTFLYGFLLSKFKNPSSKLIFSIHDLQTQVVLRGRDFESPLLYWTIRSEAKLLGAADSLRVLSEKDKIFVENLLDLSLPIEIKKPSLAPFVYSVKHQRVNSPSESNTLIYWGAMSRRENEVAVIYFHDKVLTRLHKNGFKYKLFIVGSNPSEKVKSLSSDLIMVTGFLEDPSEFFLRASIGVIPLEKGAGVKLKTLELLESGISRVIATPVGAEGISDATGRLFVKNLNDFYANLVSWYKN